MLVLNSNESGQSKKSNSMFIGYPDFSQILIMPNSFSGTDTNEAFSVNGTIVNQITQTLDEKFLSGNNAGGDIGITECGFKIGDGELTSTTRVGTLSQLNGGEVIGKNIIIFPVAIYGNGGSSSREVNSTYNIEVVVGLLHTDGSITQIATVSNSGSSPTYIGAGYTHYYKQIQQVVKTTDGVVAQAGDRVICDIIIKNAGNQSRAYSGVSFGALGSSVADTQPHPIQISIE